MDNGVPHSATDVRDMIMGILSAPENTADPDRWLSLISTKRDPEIDEQLTSLKEKIKHNIIETPLTEQDLEKRLTDLRQHMAKQNIDGFLVPRSDEFQGEYVPARAERLAWITGFTGSAGSAIILKESAAFFTDGRYTIDAKANVPASLFNICSISPNQGDVPTIQPTDWISKNLSPGGVLAYDPWLHTKSQITDYNNAAELASGSLEPCTKNPLDLAWLNQPPPPLSLTVEHPLAFSGETSRKKRTDLAVHLVRKKCDAVVLTLPEDIAWLLNIRGNDVPCTPLPLCFAIAFKDKTVQLFINIEKMAPGLMHSLGASVRTFPIEKFESALADLGREGNAVSVDPTKTAMAVFQILDEHKALIIEEPSPCQLPKACKNKIEVAGTIAAHIRDGVSLCRFLARLSKQDFIEKHSELSAATILEEYRSTNDYFRGLSFDTISGMGSNGAIVHYRVTPKTDKSLTDGEIYLVDSGAQYLDGTTDVTRTVALKTPSDEMKDRFTRVLKGHIQVALSVFDMGTAGDALDKKARASLKVVGLDFAHGTGHGVGSYLSVHEGPQGISPRAKTPFEPGMIVSNEPGYYKEGAYGIRIENLVVVQSTNEGKLKFKTLTMAPIDANLIDTRLLDDEEIAWINDYHDTVKKKIGPLLQKTDPAAAAWLIKATKAL